MDTSTIIIADDHPVIRAGLNHIIGKSHEFSIIAEAENKDELLECLENSACDIVILDMRMPDYGDGIEAIIRNNKKFLPENLVNMNISKIFDIIDKNEVNKFINNIKKNKL